MDDQNTSIRQEIDQIARSLNKEKNSVFGYVRVSTTQSSLEEQVIKLLKFGVPKDNIFADKMMSNHSKSEDLQSLFAVLKEGDTLVINKLDRLGKSMTQVTDMITKLMNQGVFLKVLDDKIDTSLENEDTNEFIRLIGIFSEMERNFIIDRTKPAIQEAQKKGVKFGRPKMEDGGIYEEAILKYLKGNVTVKDIIEQYGKDSSGKPRLTEATFFRRLKIYKESKN